MTGFTFPPRRRKTIVETALMRQVADRTTSTHNDSSICVWTGRSRVGKTTTAEWLEDRINAAYDAANPDAFQARRYQATELAAGRGVIKRAMGALHAGVLGTLDSGLLRRLTPDDLASLIVTGLSRQRIEMVFIDEAGLYCLSALRALVAIRDKAVERGQRLTLVLIGMDDLPLKIQANPQVKGRVHEWCYFSPYRLEETIKLVQCISEPFAGLPLSDREVHRQFEFIHQVTSGLAGQIVPFVHKVERELELSGRPLSVSVLKVTHLKTQREKTRAQSAARRGYAEESDTEEKSGS